MAILNRIPQFCQFFVELILQLFLQLSQLRIIQSFYFIYLFSDKFLHLFQIIWVVESIITAHFEGTFDTAGTSQFVSHWVHFHVNF